MSQIYEKYKIYRWVKFMRFKGFISESDLWDL